MTLFRFALGLKAYGNQERGPLTPLLSSLVETGLDKEWKSSLMSGSWLYERNWLPYAHVSVFSMGCVPSDEKDKLSPVDSLSLFAKYDDLRDVLLSSLSYYTEFLSKLCDLLELDDLKIQMLETSAKLKAGIVVGQYSKAKEISKDFQTHSHDIIQKSLYSLQHPSVKTCSNCFDLNDQVCDLKKELLQQTTQTLNFQHLYEGAQEDMLHEVEECQESYRLLNTEFDKSLLNQSQLSAEYDALLAAYDDDTRQLKRELSVLASQLNCLKMTDHALKLSLDAGLEGSKVGSKLLETTKRLAEAEYKLEEMSQCEEYRKARRRTSCALRLKRSVAVTQSLVVAKWRACVPVVSWSADTASEVKGEFLEYAAEYVRYSPKALDFFEKHLDSKYAADSLVKSSKIKQFACCTLELLKSSAKASLMLSNLIALKARHSAYADLLTRLLGASKHRSMPLVLSVIINRLRVSFNSSSEHKSSVSLYKALRLVFNEFKEHVEVRDYIALKLCPNQVPTSQFLSSLMKFTLNSLGCTLTFKRSLEEAAPYPSYSEEETLHAIELLQRATAYQVSEYLLRLYFFEVCKHAELELSELDGTVHKLQLLQAVEEAFYVSAGLVSSCSSVEEGHLN
jgi:hypothetical protein